MAHMVNCIKLGREAEGLDYPPLPGALGMKIYNNVSKEAWEQWKHLQTMIVNENRLSMADPRARKWLMDQIEAHFSAKAWPIPKAMSRRKTRPNNGF